MRMDATHLVWPAGCFAPSFAHALVFGIGGLQDGAGSSAMARNMSTTSLSSMLSNTSEFTVYEESKHGPLPAFQDADGENMRYLGDVSAVLSDLWRDVCSAPLGPLAWLFLLACNLHGHTGTHANGTGRLRGR